MVTIGHYILLNLLIAILVDSFSNDVQFSLNDYGNKNNFLSNQNKSRSTSTEFQTEFDAQILNPTCNTRSQLQLTNTQTIMMKEFDHSDYQYHD